MPYVTPGVILWVIAAFVIGAVSMGFNPLFIPSAGAIGAGLVALRGARPLEHPTARGILMGFAIMGIMGGLGGITIAVRMLLALGN